MSVVTAQSLADLYSEDETGWLEAMAELIRRRDLSELDLDHLSEYLTDMAARDRREVKSRLVILLAHLLKWEFQPDMRSHGWRTTVLNRRQKLVDVAGRGVLRTHAEAVLSEAYENALKLAEEEAGLPRSSFPESFPYQVEQLFAIYLSEGDEAQRCGSRRIQRARHHSRPRLRGCLGVQPLQEP